MTRLRLLDLLLLTVMATLSLTQVSYGDPCSALRSQMQSGGRGGVSPELAQLRRQLAAIQGLERQRRCTASSAVGGFFNACADLARNRAEVQRRIASSGNSGRDSSGLQARYVALGCQTAPKRQQPPKPGASSPTYGGNAMLFCVRLSDGYFFPAPNSQFAQAGDLKDTADQCRYICDDPGVDLYTLSDPSLETDQMVAVETRKPYTELPTAFRYRDAAEFKACDLKRYSRRVTELRARTVTPGNMENAIIPLPTTRPDLDTVSAIASGGSEVSAGAATTPAAAVPASAKPVRMVGPTFFPAN
ncbi:DUF2865 domain-containing protein [Mesorhizobium sp. M2A.F.Ca.ET.042.01.1.1]|uniref:DUF2865 domain-containing protein n=1 Tax=Mesorhizobium sp. M2A.F.Ca.ET.042.01.1.1 TaxID=2496745 RepID=UPI000FCC58FA|nr:DUF2865 domain-containing protein [Mesorhizobium sp. M2A.F.Ca.ET.042.01.1.1]RUX31257.1 DUF2865 domain-containing protein [Mesorhizobium sp. M2A.F.Ca.ET.042.01.1.1]